jgi:hypothetical protein
MRLFADQKWAGGLRGCSSRESGAGWDARIVRIAEATGRCPSCDQYTVETEHDRDGELVWVFCGDPNCGWVSEISQRP